MKTLLFLITVMMGSVLHGQNSITKFSGRMIQYSPDNTALAVANRGGLALYAPRAGEKFKTLLSGEKRISAMSYSNDGQHLAAVADGVIYIWDLKNGKLNYQIESRIRFRSIALLKRGTQLIGMDDHKLYWWDLPSARMVKEQPVDGKRLRGFVASADEKLLAVGGAGRSIFIYSDSVTLQTTIKNAHGHWVRSLAFDPKSGVLASGGDDGRIALWDITNGNSLGRFSEAKGWITDLEYSPDGRYLFASNNVGSISIYSIENHTIHSRIKGKEPVLSVSMSGSGKEIAATQYGNKSKIWDVAALGITPVLRLKDGKDKSAPLIMVSNPPNIQDNRALIYKDLIDLRGTVTDESGVRSLKINNITTPVRDNGNFLINIPLAMGDNYINMEVTDVNDNIALKKIVITRKSMQGEEYNAVSAKNHLLVVGINNYQHWPKLNNAVKDANDIVSILMRKYNFEFSNVTLLKDEQATRSNIYNGLRGLIEKVSPQDNLVIYFSGHGFFDQLLNEGYWIPVEAHPNSSGEYISNTDILKILSNINSQHTFLVADACFSGALFSDSRRGYTDNVEKFKSRWGLASGRLETVSDGAIGGNSPFAEKVLKFLQENSKDKFAVSELIQYVKTQVAEETNQTPIGNPLKALGDEGGEMVLYKKKN